MAYIDKTYFNEYTTADIDDSEFAILAERASDIIDMLTMNKIGLAGGLTALLSPVQAAVKKATAAQVETLYAQGGVEAVNGNADTNTGSVTIGKFSMTGGSSGLELINGIPVSPLVRSYLLYTGLMYRGI